MAGGKGLSVDRIDGIAGPEERRKQDSTPRTTTAPALEELVGVAEANY